MNLIRKRRRSAVEDDLEKEFYEPYRKRQFAVDIMRIKTRVDG